MEVEAFQKLDPHTFYRKFLSRKIRPDGRQLQQVRDITVLKGVLPNDHIATSALVTLGGTKVVAAIRLQVGEIREKKASNRGEVEIHATLSPLCSSKFSRGRLPEQASSLEVLLRSILVDSQLLNLEDLCIERDQSAWKLVVDVYCLSYDGNVTDAAILATIVCIINLRLPPTSVTDDGEVMISEGKAMLLSLSDIPFPLTVGLFDGITVTDPSNLEEEIISSMVTVVQTASGRLLAIQKPGGSRIQTEELSGCIALSLKHSMSMARSPHFQFDHE